MSNGSATMNGLILAAARRGRTTGTFGRTGGTPTPTNPALRERLSAALNDLNAAERAGDGDAIAFHNFRVDKLTDEARTGRQQQSDDERPRDPHTGQFVSGFDGGVQRQSVGLRHREETAGQMFQRAVTQSHIERGRRVDDGTVAGNIANV